MPHQLQTFGVDVLRLVVWLVILVVIFVPLERAFAVRPGKILRAGFATDLGYYFFSSLVPGLIIAVPMAAVAWGVHRLLPSAIGEFAASLPLALRIVAALVVGEIGFYWGHRWSHEIPWLWRFHALHHSAEHLDWLVNTRAHPVDMVFGKICGLIPLYVVGLAQPLSGRLDLVPVIVVLVGTVWGFFIHANIKWRFGWFESLVATPAFHHWHHTRNDHIDKNYAAMLPFVDRLFGTWYVPREWPTDYGTDHPVPARMYQQIVAPMMRTVTQDRSPNAPVRPKPSPPIVTSRGSVEHGATNGD